MTTTVYVTLQTMAGLTTDTLIGLMLVRDPVLSSSSMTCHLVSHHSIDPACHATSSSRRCASSSSYTAFATTFDEQRTIWIQPFVTTPIHVSGQGRLVCHLIPYDLHLGYSVEVHTLDEATTISTVPTTINCTPVQVTTSRQAPSPLLRDAHNVELARSPDCHVSYPRLTRQLSLLPLPECLRSQCHMHVETLDGIPYPAMAPLSWNIIFRTSVTVAIVSGANALHEPLPSHDPSRGHHVDSVRHAAERKPPPRLYVHVHVGDPAVRPAFQLHTLLHPATNSDEGNDDDDDDGKLDQSRERTMNLGRHHSTCLPQLHTYVDLAPTAHTYPLNTDAIITTYTVSIVLACRPSSSIGIIPPGTVELVVATDPTEARITSGPLQLRQPLIESVFEGVYVPNKSLTLFRDVFYVCSSSSRDAKAGSTMINGTGSASGRSTSQKQGSKTVASAATLSTQGSKENSEDEEDRRSQVLQSAFRLSIRRDSDTYEDDGYAALKLDIFDALTGNLLVTATDIGTCQILHLPPCSGHRRRHSQDGMNHLDLGGYIVQGSLDATHWLVPDTFKSNAPFRPTIVSATDESHHTPRDQSTTKPYRWSLQVFTAGLARLVPDCTILNKYAAIQDDWECADRGRDMRGRISRCLYLGKTEEAMALMATAEYTLEQQDEMLARHAFAQDVRTNQVNHAIARSSPWTLLDGSILPEPRQGDRTQHTAVKETDVSGPELAALHAKASASALEAIKEHLEHAARARAKDSVQRKEEIEQWKQDMFELRQEFLAQRDELWHRREDLRKQQANLTPIANFP
jgi:hypothetical protein